jgi:hypothetical protein
MGFRDNHNMPDSMETLNTDRFAGCLLGGAVGDALGASVEFSTLAEILERYGPGGIQHYAFAYGRLGAITDDTQMTLFTAEGLIRTWTRLCAKGITTHIGVTRLAYLRWLATQGIPQRDTRVHLWSPARHRGCFTH